MSRKVGFVPIEIRSQKGQVLLVYPGENLVNADLSNKDLKHVVLAGINCSGAKFDGADLEFAHCRGTNFTGASFRNAYMVYGQFHEANFTEADFEGVNIERAKFLGANLTGIKNWHKRERDYQAKFMGATMPDGRKVDEE